MPLNHLEKKAREYLLQLSQEIQRRSVGSPGNRQATQFFEKTVSAFGFQTDCPQFECIDWMESGAYLRASSESFEVFPSPYSLGCNLHASLVTASTLAELATCEAQGRILLVSGELTKEQLMPKKFPFYNPEEHQQIYRLLESKTPLAIVTATTRNPELAGALYPFPLIEDGDFDIPSVFLTEDEGRRLANYHQHDISLEVRAQRIPAIGWNVVARKNPDAGRKIVFFAHIDSKLGTPGALDNAAGVVVLLLLSELLEGYEGKLSIQIVAMNGEDYYAAPGEIKWLEENQDKLDKILLGINLDGVGYLEGKTGYSLYGCPNTIEDSINAAFSTFHDIVQGDLWYQSDHMLFVQNQVPALALTSISLNGLLESFIHTAQDRLELVDGKKLAHIALALRDLILDLERRVEENLL